MARNTLESLILCCLLKASKQAATQKDIKDDFQYGNIKNKRRML